MCSRQGVWQLEKLTLQYCGWGGSSRGLREFVRYGLGEFAGANPQLKCVVSKKNNRHPLLIGEYVRGEPKVMDVKNKDPDTIFKMCKELRNSSGRKMTKIKKFEVKPVVSLQGEWSPGAAKKVPMTIRKL